MPESGLQVPRHIELGLLQRVLRAGGHRWDCTGALRLRTRGLQLRARPSLILRSHLVAICRALDSARANR